MIGTKFWRGTCLKGLEQALVHDAGRFAISTKDRQLLRVYQSANLLHRIFAHHRYVNQEPVKTVSSSVAPKASSVKSSLSGVTDMRFSANAPRSVPSRALLFLATKAQPVIGKAAPIAALFHVQAMGKGSLIGDFDPVDLVRLAIGKIDIDAGARRESPVSSSF